MRKQLFIIGMFALPVFTGCTPEPVKEAEEALTLHYINNQIYSPVDCRTKEIDGDYYVFCTPVGPKIGGLYQIEYTDDGQYQIFTVNGKAAQHTEKSNIQVKRKNDYVDISRIIDEF